MSEEQLTALLTKLNEDAGLREKLQGAADLDAAAAMMKEAGFGALLDVSREDLLKYQANQTVELSDEALGNVSGGVLPYVIAELGITVLDAYLAARLTPDTTAAEIWNGR